MFISLQLVLINASLTTLCCVKLPRALKTSRILFISPENNIFIIAEKKDFVILPTYPIDVYDK